MIATADKYRRVLDFKFLLNKYMQTHSSLGRFSMLFFFGGT